MLTPKTIGFTASIISKLLVLVDLFKNFFGGGQRERIRRDFAFVTSQPGRENKIAHLEEETSNRLFEIPFDCNAHRAACDVNTGPACADYQDGNVLAAIHGLPACDARQSM